MLMTEEYFYHGLPNLYPKLPKKLTKSVKSSLSKYASKHLELFSAEPIPYQRDTFKPSTISKIIDIPKRFMSGFLDNESEDIQPQRGIILHTRRYVWSSIREINQSERLIAEENYLKKVKYMKKLSETRQKFPNQSLILEGEPIPLGGTQSEKSEVLPVLQNKGKPLFETNDNNSGGMTSVIEIIGSEPLNPQPVSIAVQKLTLKNRISGSESISSVPVHDSRRSLDDMNMSYQTTNTKPLYDRLPAILTAPKDLNSHERSSDISFGNHFDYESLYRQSERSYRPSGRINEYIMDGISMKFTERADIQGEINNLKSIILPSIARELYVGRGIQLPSNHAIKIPRGRQWIGERKKVSESHKEIKSEVFVQENGSINANTLIEVKNDQKQNQKEDYVNTENLKRIASEDIYESMRDLIEQVKTNVPKDDNGYMETQALKSILFRNSGLSEEWKESMTPIIHSIDHINMEQLVLLLETGILSKHFQDGIPSYEMDDAKQLMPLIFKLLNQSNNTLRFEDIRLLLNDSNPSLSQQDIGELYGEFFLLIPQETHSSSGNIPKSQALLFIPYLLRRLKI